MMTNGEILKIAMLQHAHELGCAPEDFRNTDNMVVISRRYEKARAYYSLPLFCSLVSYGSNVVASVDERIRDVVLEYINTRSVASCFETPQLHKLSEMFRPLGYIPCFQAEYWLPDVNALEALPIDYQVRLLEPEQFQDLYQPQWSNALVEQRRERDKLAVGAYDGETLIGLAGCSTDCESMWQIGIDVLPEYRKQGVAAALTSRLALEVLGRGKVPFYCCAWSNIASARNAYRSGFRPAWVELTAIHESKVRSMIK